MTAPIRFDVKAVDRSTGARVGRLELARGGVVDTPVFMPVGTQAAIRTLPPSFLEGVGAQIILANTYHLHQRPGEALVEKMGGLHDFMAVDVPILTDSGGFQVFSLDKKTLSEEGVAFSYEVDGKATFLSPETSMAIQMALGADIAMAFDECLPPDADRARTEASVDLTARWEERSLAAHTREDQSLFGIVQGGMHADLRQRSAQQITSLPFDGFAIGGLSVGEGPEIMNAMLEVTTPRMPANLPRYLMGVGRPQDLVDGVAHGVDMFDCVIPTRHARSATVYTFQGRMRLTHAKYRRDAYPIDTSCGCYTCRNFSRAYIHHLMSVGEVLASTLCTIHNLYFFSELMRRVRASIADGTFSTFRKHIKALYPEKGDKKPAVKPIRHRGAAENPTPGFAGRSRGAGAGGLGEPPRATPRAKPARAGKGPKGRGAGKAGRGGSKGKAGGRKRR